jgi:Flp pilus assembly protein TadG
MLRKFARGKSGTRSRLGASLASVEGSQLFEFALAAPLLLVFAIGIMDFGGAYNLKQELNNAAREGARYAANQSSNILDVKTAAAAQAVGNVVQNYLTSARLTQCTFTAPGNPTLVYTYGGNPAGCSLVVNRAFVVINGTTNIISTKVTLTYPYSWTVGKIIKLILPSSTLSLPTTVSSDGIMQNIN